MAWIEHEHPDADTLARRVAGALQDACLDAIAMRGRAVLALAGGQTPLPVYQQLATRAVDWSKVVVLPTDERCVPHAHPACNTRALRAALDGARGITLESLSVDDGDPAASLAHTRLVLARHPGPFDALVLGMGVDAHTASLFPGAAHIARALDPANPDDACRIDPPAGEASAGAPFPRISLSLARLRRARSVHLVISGDAKRAVLQRVLAHNAPLRWPVAAMLHAPATVTQIHWSP